MGVELPARPVSPDQKYLAAVVARLDDQNALLSRILDRLPEPVRVDVETGTVELREPAPPAAVERQPETEPEQAPKPAPARRTRKTSPKGKT